MLDPNTDPYFRKGDAKTDVFGSDAMLQAAPVDRIPVGPTTPEIAYQMVKDETFAQTQPRLNLATFVTTYMDEYATRLMNEAININYIDETEYPRIAVMNGKCINIMANLWNTPETSQWKTGALAIGSSEACMLGGIAAWIRWRERRQKEGKPFDKPNFVISTGYQVVWEKFAQLWQIEMRTVPLTLEKTTLDPEEALKMCDENTICIVPIEGVTWTGLNDDVEALDKALDANRLRYSYPCGCSVRRIYTAVPLPRSEMGLPPQMGTLNQHIGPQVRPRISRSGMGCLERQEVSSRRDVVQRQLSRRGNQSGGSELLTSGSTDSRTVLPVYPPRLRRIQERPVQLSVSRQVSARTGCSHAGVPAIFKRCAQPDLHLADETRCAENRKMDSVRSSGQTCPEGMDGAGLHVARKHREYRCDACALQTGLQPRHGRPAARRHPLCCRRTQCA